MLAVNQKAYEWPGLPHTMETPDFLPWSLELQKQTSQENQEEAAWPFMT